MKKFFFILFAFFTILGQANATRRVSHWIESWFYDPDDSKAKKVILSQLSHTIADYIEPQIGRTALLGPISWIGSRSVHCMCECYPEDFILENASNYMGLCCLASCACAWCMAAAAGRLQDKKDPFQELYGYGDKPKSFIMSSKVKKD